MPLRLPEPQDILDQARDDIAEKPLDEAPPAANEPRGHPLLRAAAAAPVAAVAMLLKKLAESLKPKDPPPQVNPGKADAPSAGQAADQTLRPGSSGGGLGDWLSKLAAKGAEAIGNLTPRQFAVLAASLEDRRNREINRLLSLLQSNPDEGLRYALPLAGDPARGLARPGGRLGPRNINFNLSRFNQSRPADPWHLSYEMQEKLRTNYRRLATRELQLGRHRRAAYVFAQLLGDYSSAANALKQGHHFREAAVLYRERLGQKLAAADCLCEGGLIIEAIPLYEELGLFESAGDLYTQLTQTAQAAACYRKAVAQLAARDDYLKAAALLETKLEAPREALALLDATWPAKPQAPACMDEAFRLLARLEDFLEAQARVKRLGKSTPQPHLVPRLAHVLAEVAATFPEDATRHLAADATRVVVGKRLPNASESEARDLTKFLPRLAPADRLLSRDAQRDVQKLLPPVGKPNRPLRSTRRAAHAQGPCAGENRSVIPPSQWAGLGSLCRRRSCLLRNSSDVRAGYLCFSTPGTANTFGRSAKGVVTPARMQRGRWCIVPHRHSYGFSVRLMVQFNYLTVSPRPPRLRALLSACPGSLPIHWASPATSRTTAGSCTTRSPARWNWS